MVVISYDRYLHDWGTLSKSPPQSVIITTVVISIFKTISKDTENYFTKVFTINTSHINCLSYDTTSIILELKMVREFGLKIKIGIQVWRRPPLPVLLRLTVRPIESMAVLIYVTYLSKL